MKAIDMIAAERARQISQEGWTPEHDDEHGLSELAAAAICYAAPVGSSIRDCAPPLFWPWDESSWKPSDPIRDLVKAGALIVAEIERLQRAGQSS